eukprot:8400975-Pyramimonas_sp.AAC.1
MTVDFFPTVDSRLQGLYRQQRARPQSARSPHIGDLRAETSSLRASVSSLKGAWKKGFGSMFGGANATKIACTSYLYLVGSGTLEFGA